MNDAGESNNSPKVTVEIPSPSEDPTDSGIMISFYLAGFLFILLLLLGFVVVVTRKGKELGEEIMDWGEE